MNRCWACKVGKHSQNYSGLCALCIREHMGDIYPVGFNGVTHTVYCVKCHEEWSMCNSALITYSNKRFADDTGWYHQFHEPVDQPRKDETK